MHPVYPLLCVAAAAGLDALGDLGEAFLGALQVAPLTRLGTAASHAAAKRRSTRRACDGAVVAILVASALISVSRTAALVTGYGAPLAIYASLPELLRIPPRPGPVRVCVGSEWHRFPGSFFLPDGYRLEFVRGKGVGAFSGQLPARFDAAAGGSAAAPGQLNDRNVRAGKGPMSPLGVFPALGLHSPSHLPFALRRRSTRHSGSPTRGYAPTWWTCCPLPIAASGEADSPSSRMGSGGISMLRGRGRWWPRGPSWTHQPAHSWPGR